jgi:hypothetical protein
MQEVDVKPPFGENYEEIYNKLDFKDKIILEIGADYGSTAFYFFSKGAKRVISVECNKDFYEQLIFNVKTIFKENDIIPIFYHIETAKEIENLINTWEPDILHMDCDDTITGFEELLPDVNKDILKKVKCFEIEIHREEAIKPISILFKNIDYSIELINYHSVGNGTSDKWTRYNEGKTISISSDCWLFFAKMIE